MSAGVEDTIAPGLEALLGREAVVTADADRWSVEGLVPMAVVRPADAEQAAAVLRWCSERGVAVIPWGGGTAMELGNPPLAAHVVLLTQRLGAVVDHDHTNLTVTVQAGATLASLEAVLAARRQFLPLEPPCAGSATAGGAVAANLNGPRRMRYGSARDLVIGMRVAQAHGVVAKFGGKTVKNVAGYDMAKLFVGSLGTLGLITELTFKVMPVPETSRTVALWGQELSRLWTLAGRILMSPLGPSAMVVVNAAAAGQLYRADSRRGGPDRGAGLLVRAEGVEPAVARHERDIAQWAHGQDFECEVLDGDAEAALWRAVRDFGWTSSGTLVRLTVPSGRTGAVAGRLAGTLPTTTGLMADPGTGTLWLAFEATADAASSLPAIADLAVASGGHLLLARAPRSLKVGRDVWMPPPAGRVLELMRALKQSFDPKGILNPGRYVAGL
jgi:glycolate oxidase FAD binding subunit